VHNFTSPETLHEICSAFVQEARLAAHAADGVASAAGNDSDLPGIPAHAVSSQGSESSFATLAAAFVNSLALGPPLDLGKDWLLHRLHCILVNHEFPKPGEIEVMRADIHVRVETSNFSSPDSELLIGGLDRVLQGFAPWQVRESGRVRTETGGGAVSP
jgi:hypothetical protein